MRYIGVDVSKATLNIAVEQGGRWHESVIANDTGAIRQWISGIGNEPTQVIFEATGSYSAKLLYLLHTQKVAFTMVNPVQSQGFAKVQNNQNQTDARDAVLLAQYGQQIRPARSIVAAERWEQLRQLRRARRQLLRYERMLANQLHALEQLPFQDATVTAALTQLQTTVEAQRRAVEKQLCTLTEAAQQTLIKNLQTIPGIGAVSAREIVLVTNGFEHFENAKQVAKFVGISPGTKTSGTTVRKRGKITRSGDPAIRGVLYMAALSACRCNLACKALYKRLKEKGKSKRQARIAVAHKLLRQAFGVAKSGKPFDPKLYLATIPAA